jgi:hypothetical protein
MLAKQGYTSALGIVKDILQNHGTYPGGLSAGQVGHLLLDMSNSNLCFVMLGSLSCLLPCECRRQRRDRQGHVDPIGISIVIAIIIAIVIAIIIAILSSSFVIIVIPTVTSYQ